MDGASLFERSSRAGSEGCRQRRPVAASGGGPIWGGHQHSDQLGTARFHETGSVKPDQIGGYRPKKIAGPHREWLIQRRRKDFTVRGLVAELVGYPPCSSRNKVEAPVSTSSQQLYDQSRAFLTMTFATAAFDRSSSWQFEASSHTATPRDRPSSLLQHDARASS